MVVFLWNRPPGARNEGYLVQLAARGKAHNGEKASAAWQKKTRTVTGAKQLADAINVGLDHRLQMFVSLVMI